MLDRNQVRVRNNALGFSPLSSLTENADLLTCIRTKRKLQALAW